MLASLTPDGLTTSASRPGGLMTQSGNSLALAPNRADHRHVLMQRDADQISAQAWDDPAAIGQPGHGGWPGADQRDGGGQRRRAQPDAAKAASTIEAGT